MKKILMVLVILVITLFSIFNTFVDAADTNNGSVVTIKINADKTQIKKGEDVTFTISANNIGQNGIIMYNTIVKFDEKVFDFAATDPAVAQSGWTLVGKVETSITYSRADLLPTKQDTVIGKIKLTAKQDATIGNTIVAFEKTDVTYENTSSVEDIVTIPDISVNIEVVEENDKEENIVSPDGNIAGGTNTVNPEENMVEGTNTVKPQGNKVNTIGVNRVDNTTSTNKLPFAGLTNVIIILIIALLLTAIAFYIKYKRTI